MPSTSQSIQRKPTLDEYWAELEHRLPRFSLDEQRAAIVLYRELAKGQAVDAVQLAAALRTSLAEVRMLLERDTFKAFVYPDDQGRIVGFGGLSASPMHHRFEVDRRRLSTWCAWDSLFIPEILGRTARVASTDPESGALVRLIVSPNRIESAEPDSAVVSFIRPEASAFSTSAVNVMAKFCHFVFFFASRRSYQRWADKHSETFAFSVDEAFALAKRLNARNFELELTTGELAQTG
jgi:alkylmercury lyase